MLFKDSEIVKNNVSQIKALNEIATMLKASDECEDKEEYFREKLLNGMSSLREHRPKRNGCKGFNKPQKGNLKEKRIYLL